MHNCHNTEDVPGEYVVTKAHINPIFFVFHIKLSGNEPHATIYASSIHMTVTRKGCLAGLHDKDIHPNLVNTQLKKENCIFN